MMIITSQMKSDTVMAYSIIWVSTHFSISSAPAEAHQALKSPRHANMKPIVKATVHKETMTIMKVMMIPSDLVMNRSGQKMRR